MELRLADTDVHQKSFERFLMDVFTMWFYVQSNE